MKLSDCFHGTDPNWSEFPYYLVHPSHSHDIVFDQTLPTIYRPWTGEQRSFRHPFHTLITYQFSSALLFEEPSGSARHVMFQSIDSSEQVLLRSWYTLARSTNSSKWRSAIMQVYRQGQVSLDFYRLPHLLPILELTIIEYAGTSKASKATTPSKESFLGSQISSSYTKTN